MGLGIAEIRCYHQYPKTTSYQHMKLLDRGEDILLSWWGYLGPQDRSMLTSKNTKDSYVQKEWGKVASGMQYQGHERRDWRTYGQVYRCHFPWQRCDWIFLVWWEHKWSIVFAVCQGKVSPYFQQRDIRKESCFCKMETRPKIASCARKLWIKSLTDYLWYPLGPLI